VPQRVYNIILIPRPEGGFTATVPALPDVVTEAETRPMALAMARDAIEGYRETIRAKGWKLPRTEHHTIRIEVKE